MHLQEEKPDMQTDGQYALTHNYVHLHIHSPALQRGVYVHMHAFVCMCVQGHAVSIHNVYTDLSKWQFAGTDCRQAYILACAHPNYLKYFPVF